MSHTPLLLLLTLPAATEPTPNLLLADAGRTSYTIRVHRDAPPPERHAAEELARFLRQISGATFPIQTVGDSPRTRGRAFASARVRPEASSLPPRSPAWGRRATSCAPKEHPWPSPGDGRAARCTASTPSWRITSIAASSPRGSHAFPRKNASRSGPRIGPSSHAWSTAPPTTPTRAMPTGPCATRSTARTHASTAAAAARWPTGRSSIPSTRS